MACLSPHPLFPMGVYRKFVSISFSSWTWLQSSLSWKQYFSLLCLSVNQETLPIASVLGKHSIASCFWFPNLQGSSGAFSLIHGETLISGKFVPWALSTWILKGPCQILKGVTIAWIATNQAPEGRSCQLAYIHPSNGWISVILCVLELAEFLWMKGGLI